MSRNGYFLALPGQSRETERFLAKFCWSGSRITSTHSLTEDKIEWRDEEFADLFSAVDVSLRLATD